MHSFLNVFNPSMHDILWIQVLGMPFAFLVRTIVLLFRAVREPLSRTKHSIRAVSNICFAVSCGVFMFSHFLAILSFVTGIGLSVWAFLIAKAQATNNRATLLPEPQTIRSPSTPRASKLPVRARMRTAK